MKKNRFEYVILLLIVVQSAIGLFFNVYRDIEWIKRTWFGNDLVTLLIISPLYFLSIRDENKQSIYKMLNLGISGYLIYNYAYYLFGAALNELFILYVVLFICAIVNIIIKLGNIKINDFKEYFNTEKSTIIISILYLFIGVGLGIVWIGMWLSYIYFNGKLPLEPEAFKLVASLDLVIIVPAMIISGISLLQKQSIGYLLGVIIGIEGSLYLFILSVNSVISGIAVKNFPGELPIWGSLFLIETIGIVLLLTNLKKHKNN